MKSNKALKRGLGCSLLVMGMALSPSAHAQGVRDDAGDISALRAELMEARALLAEQTRQMNEQKQRLDMLEQRLAGLAAASSPAPGIAPAVTADAAGADGSPIRVGQPPEDADRAPTVAVLDQQGSVVTRKGQLMAELGFDYTRADRNRAIFRGVGIPGVLIGAFDINESRQDILTASGTLRYGLTDRFEIGVRVPFIYRSDKQVMVPLVNSQDEARAVDSSVRGSGLGDIEVTARYQINNGGHNTPFLIANLQAVIPTGRDPFSVDRNSLGVARQVATGAGFWGVTPSLTAILPSEPAVLFGTVGYTYNFAKDVDALLPSAQIDRLDPGNQINISAGVGLALNERTSLNFGYNHAWSMGTTTIVRRLNDQSTAPVGEPFSTKSRDLQIGRFLFGVSHRFSDLIQLNWTVEVGATQDAPDVRTALRLPIVF
ncbi:MAG: transporter [Sphingobium sp.]